MKVHVFYVLQFCLAVIPFACSRAECRYKARHKLSVATG